MQDLIPLTTNQVALTAKQQKQAVQAGQQAHLDVYNHGLQMAIAREIDRIDTFALSDVITTAAEEECRFLDFGLHLADGSPIKLELLARKLQLLSNINNQRIAQRFGR